MTKQCMHAQLYCRRCWTPIMGQRDRGGWTFACECAEVFGHTFTIAIASHNSATGSRWCGPVDADYPEG